ncbi:hypothetical protein N5U04_06940 [Aliarcobacter butzleri]|uniref:hypothetical protein n=1 Tax=Aliarcobacter butzleri TaxID=28197 RepID=UPI0021B284B0|nr:hypothetical protein [Aliarcobacter butzleri]MCT7550697.1 hypothetical protein [Aliarcobacter butzleri]MCT7559296.1 hypothetical protein [Aliarcobacter butzleri]
MIKRFINYAYLFFSQYKFFWYIQKKQYNLIFSIKKLLFNIKKTLINNTETNEAYKTFFEWSFAKTVIIILLTYVLQIINPYIDFWVKTLLNEYLKPDNVIFTLNPINNSEYITFLSAIAAIGGVFIALYFSSLSAINATLYSTFSKNLRDLLYRDTVSNTYIKLLSYTTFFSFTLIGFFLLGFEKIYISIPILLLLIGFSIFSYYGMGSRMHELLSSDTLSHSIFNNLYKYINYATKNDIYNKDISFQKHYFRLASQEIKLLKSLIETSLTNYKIYNTSFENINLNIFKLLGYYQIKKRLIPYDSLWYKQDYEHKDLYKMGNFSNLDIFLKNATIPQGKNKSDLFWIEDKLINYVIKIIIKKVENDEIEDYQDLLAYLLNYLKLLVKHGNINYAIKIVKKIKQEINIDTSREKSALFLTDYIYSLPIEIILEFIKNINIYSYNYVSDILNMNNSLNTNIIINFNENISETLNWLHEKLSLEIKTEGKIISHKWYQTEIIMLSLSRIFIENIEIISNLLENFFNNDFKDKNIQAYSFILNRKWECINKYISNFDSIENILEEYLKQRKISGLEWIDFSIEMYKTKNKLLKKNCIVEIGDTLTLIDSRKDDKFPDIKGFFLQTISDNLLDLGIEDNYDELKKIYPNFLISSMFKFYDLKPTFNAQQLDSRKQNQLVQSFLPILNLIEITGLIKIILDFNKDQDTWDFIEKYWLDLLKNKDKFINIDFIHSVISLSDSHIAVTPGYDQRFIWNTKIRNYLKSKIKKGFFNKNYKDEIPIFHQEEIVLHDNVLIREYIGSDDYSSNLDGISIFIYTILTKHFKENKLKFGWERDQESFESSLNRNQKIYQEYNNAKQKA